MTFNLEQLNQKGAEKKLVSEVGTNKRLVNKEQGIPTFTESFNQRRRDEEKERIEDIQNEIQKSSEEETGEKKQTEEIPNNEETKVIPLVVEKPKEEKSKIRKLLGEIGKLGKRVALWATIGTATATAVLPKETKGGGMLGIGKDLANLTARGRIAENVYPFNYYMGIPRLFNTVVLNKKENRREDAERIIKTNTPPYQPYNEETLKRRLDALNMYMGFKPKYDSFEESQYRPSINDDENLKYYTFKDKELAKKMVNKTVAGGNNIISHLTDKDRGYDYEAGLLGNYKIDRGQDKRGNYTSGYDKWDVPGAWLLGAKAPRFYFREYEEKLPTDKQLGENIDKDKK